MGSYVVRAQAHIKSNVDLPAGYSVNWSGQYEYLVRAQERFSYLAPVTLMIIVILLFACFRRMQEVAIILMTLPLSAVGGLWLLYYLDYHLSVAVGVGFIALAGIAIELGVILLAYLNQAIDDAREECGALTRDEILDAVIDGATRRVRPVTMTVLASIAGLLPLLVATGTGSEIMTRMATPMVGGLLTAFLLTMLVLPVIFLLWQTHQMTRSQGEEP